MTERLLLKAARKTNAKLTLPFSIAKMGMSCQDAMMTWNPFHCNIANWSAM
jgi:hypothetical protein